MPPRASGTGCASWCPPSLCAETSEQEGRRLSGRFVGTCGELSVGGVGRTPTRRLVLLRFKEAGAEREVYELGAVLQAQLVHDAGAICIYAFRAEMQQLADFGRGVTLRGETQDFALPNAEPIHGTFPFCARLLLVFDQHLGRARIEEDFVVCHGADRTREVLGRASLAHEAFGRSE